MDVVVVVAVVVVADKQCWEMYDKDILFAHHLQRKSISLQQAGHVCKDLKKRE